MYFCAFDRILPNGVAELQQILKFIVRDSGCLYLSSCVCLLKFQLSGSDQLKKAPPIPSRFYDPNTPEIPYDPLKTPR